MLTNLIHMIPFKGVKFPHFFLADQLTSLTVLLYDLEFALCFFVSNAWVGGDGSCSVRWCKDNFF